MKMMKIAEMKTEYWTFIRKKKNLRVNEQHEYDSISLEADRIFGEINGLEVECREQEFAAAGIRKRLEGRRKDQEEAKIEQEETRKNLQELNCQMEKCLRSLGDLPVKIEINKRLCSLLETLKKTRSVS